MAMRGVVEYPRIIIW